MRRPRYIIVQRNKPRPSSNRNNKNSDTNQKKSFDKWGNYNERITLVIGIIVMVVTLYLFNETRKATKAASDSATAAQNTYAEQVQWIKFKKKAI